MSTALLYRQRYITLPMPSLTIVFPLRHGGVEILGDIAERDFAYWYILYTYRPIDVFVPWSVCLSRSCIVLKRQKISTRFPLLTTA